MKRILILLPFLILLSCSVQKRKYQKGYYVSWKHQSQNDKTKETAKAARPASAVAISNEAPATSLQQLETLLADAQRENALSLAKEPKKPNVFKKDDPCDEIVFKDGTEQKAKIIEITPTEVKYKKCDLPDGPLYVSRKSEIFMVKYANGTKEVFKSEPENLQAPAKGKTINPANQRVHPMAVLSVILGVLGIYPVIGIASIAAILLANYALRKINEQPELYKGEGAARAGKILGIIGLALAILYILIILIAVALFI